MEFLTYRRKQKKLEIAGFGSQAEQAASSRELGEPNLRVKSNIEARGVAGLGIPIGYSGCAVVLAAVVALGAVALEPCRDTCSLMSGRTAVVGLECAYAPRNTAVFMDDL